VAPNGAVGPCWGRRKTPPKKNKQPLLIFGRSDCRTEGLLIFWGCLFLESDFFPYFPLLYKEKMTFFGGLLFHGRSAKNGQGVAYFLGLPIEGGCLFWGVIFVKSLRK
jgi:hypothetical protein